MSAIQKLKKQIGYLNSAVGFGGSLNFEKVAEAVSTNEVPPEEVNRILKDVEEKAATIKNPTAYVVGAMRNGKRHGSGGATAGAPRRKPAPYLAEVPAGEEDDAKLRRRIGYLNNTEGGFAGTIKYNSVAEAACGIASNFVMEVLKQAEEKREDLTDPTGWICVALKKRAARGMGGGGGSYGSYAGMPSENANIDQALRKRIGWLNKEGGFDGNLRYDKVFAALSQVGGDYDFIMKVLKDLEKSEKQVNDPTAYVTAALRKRAPYAPGSNSSPLDEDEDYKLRKRIGWLNNKGGLSEHINYRKIAEAASQSGAPMQNVMSILKDVEEQKDSVKDATAFAAQAIRKAGVRAAAKGDSPSAKTTFAKTGGIKALVKKAITKKK